MSYIGVRIAAMNSGHSASVFYVEGVPRSGFFLWNSFPEELARFFKVVFTPARLLDRLCTGDEVFFTKRG